MKLINFNEMSNQFANKCYDYNEDDIKYDILEFAKKIRLNDDIDTANAIKGLRAILSYCGIKHIDLNRFFKLSI